MTTIMFILLDDRIGGTPMRILNIVKNINKDKFKVVTVIPEGSGDFGNKLKDLGLSVYRKDIKRLRYSINPKFLVSWILNLPSAYREISGIIEKEKVNIIHSFGLTQITGPIIAKFKSVKVIWQINDMVTPFPDIFLFIAKRISDVIAISSDAVGKRYSLSSIDKRIVKLYSAVDFNKFSKKDKRIKIRSELGITPGTVLIGTVGNINKFKGHPDFITACHDIKNKSVNKRVKFVIIGNISDRWDQYYKQLLIAAESYGLKNDIIFTGKRLDVQNLLAAIDIYVHPSKSESFGLAIIEAMAAGKPVVATDVGGIPEIIPDSKYGLLVPPGKPELLAEKILYYINNQEIAQQIGEQGAQRVKEIFSIKEFIKKHEELYLSLAESE